MTFDKVNFGRQNCESMAVRISRSYKIVQNRAQFQHYYHPPSWSDLTTTTTSPNPVITANDRAVHIQGQIQDFCRRGHQQFSVWGAPAYNFYQVFRKTTVLYKASCLFNCIVVTHTQIHTHSRSNK